MSLPKTFYHRVRAVLAAEDGGDNRSSRIVTAQHHTQGEQVSGPNLRSKGRTSPEGTDRWDSKKQRRGNTSSLGNEPKKPTWEAPSTSQTTQSQGGVLTKLLSIFETGAGSNLLQKDIIHAALNHRTKHGHLPDIRDANEHPLKLLGSINLAVQLPSFIFKVNVFVCESLSAPIILAAYFCDKFVQAI